jgi:SAM-dependent methyltransferase
MRWDAGRYQSSFAFVTRHGKSLIDVLAPSPGQRIVDLGCGTGLLTAEIAAHGATVVGVDSSAQMIATARADYPDLAFELADGHDFSVAGPQDAVFSNAALHWMSRDPDAVIARVHAALAPGGRFVAEFGAAGNCAVLLAAVRAGWARRGVELVVPWYFPSPAEHAARLERGGFTLRELRYFDRPSLLDRCADGIADWLGMFGPDMVAQLPPATVRDALAEVNELAAPQLRRPDGWYADYVRLCFVAERG